MKEASSSSSAPKPRRVLDRRIKVWSGKDFAECLHGRCIDLSETGVGATLAGKLEPGLTVQIELSTGNGRATLRLGAAVRNQKGFYHGFKFEDVPQAARRELQRLLDGVKES